jgi:cutinase
MKVIKLIRAKWARRQVVDVSARHFACFLGVAMVTTWALLNAAVPSVSAQPCPDVEVVFARGTDEPPGVGGIGQAFVDALRSQVGTRSVAVYAVNYAASSDFANPVEFARTFVDGIRDAAAHVQSTAASCPNTRMVLGGFSQGAAVAGFVTSAVVPGGVPAALVPAPMPLEVADHVAAVALLGKPSNEFLRQYGAPPIAIGQSYAAKTIELCAPGDTICSGAAGGGPNIAHALYGVNGMASQAAAFAASRL